MRFTAETRGYLKCKISPRLTSRGGRTYWRVRTIFSEPKFLGCIDNQVFLPMVLRYYRQLGGVAMGSRLGPNYMCMFMGHIEEQTFDQYTRWTPDLYKRYIDDIVWAFAGSRQEIEDFATFVDGFHPSLKFTWSFSDEQLPFHDLVLKPTTDRLGKSIHYNFNTTDIHSYLNYAFSHPTRR